MPEEEYHRLGRKRQERSYSDSDNEYEHEIFVRSKDREGRGILDMDVHMDGEWGRRSLVETLDGTRLESLIAWAHDGAISGIPSTVPGVHERIYNPSERLPNAPLPFSYLNHLMHQSGRVPEFSEDLVEKFDTSALVAVGMIMEEILTASLLPLAGCHVLRCRELDSKPGMDDALHVPLAEIKLEHPISKQPITFDPRNLPDDESTFSAWTLPPEEAILQAAKHGMFPDTGIPLLQDPIRLASNPSLEKSEVVKAEDVIRRLFANINEKNKKFLSSNNDLLGLFMAKVQHKRQRVEFPAPRSSAP